jgi:hypothetical protein
MRELLYIPYYIWYIVEWLIRLVALKDAKEAYRRICFEREAYMYESDLDYLKVRSHYKWVWYL